MQNQLEQFQFSFICKQGPRDHMEDTFSFAGNFGEPGQIFAGVYDGHSGKAAAGYACREMPEVFLKHFKSSGSAETAFKKAYDEISVSGPGDSGACAANYFIKDQVIYFANAGDSHIMVMNRSKSKLLTTDHRLESPDERWRFIQLHTRCQGRYVMMPDGIHGLMPTRTLGDHKYKKLGVISEPSVGEYRIQPSDVFLIAGTDGLFDEMDCEKIRQLVRTLNKVEEVAKTLEREVSQRNGSDNLTILVLKLN